MTPRDFMVISDAKIAQIRDDRRFMDTLHATQTARLINISGRAVETPKHPNECMTFQWDESATEIKTEMTEEDMTRFDQNMDQWSGVRPRD